jgi:hypothetical protein
VTALLLLIMLILDSIALNKSSQACAPGNNMVSLFALYVSDHI